MQSITRETIQSLVGYMNAPVLERRCISIIASRTQSADLKQYRGAFEEVDMDGDGRISHFDLRRSMQAVWRILSLSIDVDALFDAMDLHHNGMINFTDFAAACLHSELAPLDDWLAEQAFNCLDLDKDGYVFPQEAEKLFGELPVGLPPVRAFDLQRWRKCLLGSSPRSDAPTSSSSSKLAKNEETRASGGLLQLLFGDQTNCYCVQKEDPVEEDLFVKVHAVVFTSEPPPLPPPPPPPSMWDSHSHHPRSRGNTNNLPLPPPAVPAYDALRERIMSNGYPLKYFRQESCESNESSNASTRFPSDLSSPSYNSSFVDY